MLSLLLYQNNIFNRNILKFQRLQQFCTDSSSKCMRPEGKQTDILIYDRITQTKVPFITRSNNFITWYVCGPTVYDSAHIGHACTYTRFDIIRRILEKYTGMNVIQVMCVTDVDDKIIQKAKESNTDWRIISKVNEEKFFLNLASLNVRKPSIVARATDFIPQMMKFIENLLEKRIAYLSSDGSVYFSIDKYGKHGKFRRTCTPLSSSIYNKRNAQDFALWKKAKPDEPFWETAWGPGRPGWHLECSTIASEYFGNLVDLHSGAIDLMFPHHENEESQSCAFHDVDQWVNYWLHTGHLTCKNEKMSKSLKNTISIEEYLRTNSFNHLRMLCLYTDYRSHVDLDGEEITQSMNMCTKFYQFFDECRSYMQGYSMTGDIDPNRLLQVKYSEAPLPLLIALDETKKNVSKFLKDDFDTKSSVCALVNLMTLTNSMLSAEKGNRCITSVCLVYLYVEELISWLGLDFSQKYVSDIELERSTECIGNIIDGSVSLRTNVRDIALSIKDANNIEVKQKLLSLCDRFRAEFHEYGVEIKDRKNNTCTWSYVRYRKTIGNGKEICDVNRVDEEQKSQSKCTSKQKETNEECGSS